MKIYKKAAEIHNDLQSLKSLGKKIGFVPTMGALHAGHLSLIQTSKSMADYTVASIFVNPTQFNNPEDFKHYPTQIEKDIELLQAIGCDAVYIPATEEIYQNGTKDLPSYQLGYLETIMEGKFRPGHFQGVCQVVEILLKTVTPDFLFLGQKDLQQCKVIERLLELKGMNIQTKLIICPTLRESDGLAMSSRNQRLNAEERKRAVAIFEALNTLKKSYSLGSYAAAKEHCIKHIEQAGLQLEYLEMVNTKTLELLQEWPDISAESPSYVKSVTACIAAYLGKVRLIDNMILYSV